MGGGLFFLLLNDADSDVGAMVAHTLGIVQQIVEDEAELDGALAALEPPDVTAADLLREKVHSLLQRFHLPSHLGIVRLEAAQGAVQQILQQGGQHIHLFPGNGGEGQLLFMKLLGGFLQVQSMVADALKVSDGVKQAGDGAHIGGGGAVLRDLDQIAAQTVLIGVQLVLVGQDLLLPAAVILNELGQSQLHAFQRQSAHAVGHDGAFADSHAGGPHQPGVQEGEVRGLVLRGDHLVGKALQLPAEGQQHKGGADVEDRVAECDANSADGLCQEGQIQEHLTAKQGQQTQSGADEVEGDVDDGHPLGIAADADRGDQSRNAGADVLAHDDGDSDAVGDGAGHGQCLQNANGGGGGLDDAGEGGAYQHTQEGIGEGSHEVGEARHICQRRHRTAHQLHAVH